MNERQLYFIKELAKFLTDDETLMSVYIRLNKPEGKKWAALRSASPLMGYYDGEEGRKTAEEELIRFFS
jgi:hypothetical protein